MNIEKFGGQPSIEKRGLRGEVHHFPKEIVAEQGDSSFAEEIIEGSDRASKENLLSAFHMMMDRINSPLLAEEERRLKNDKGRRDRINMLVNGYLEAVKTLNMKEQDALRNSLKQLFSEIEEE